MAMNILNISFLRAWFVRPLIRLLSWIGVGSRMLNYNSETLQVFVKISGVGSQQLTTPLLLQKHWTVQDVKAHLGAKLKKSADCFKIILAGRELNDSILVSDCDLGPQTVIHAIQIVLVDKENISQFSIIKEPATSKEPLNASLLDLQLTEEEHAMENSRDDATKRRAHFYVYCDAPSCRTTVPQPGKLRVRCTSCNEGAVTVLNDPCSWDDVLLPSRIEGTCHNPSCHEFRKLVYVQFFFKCRGENHELQAADSQEAETPPLNLIRPNIHQIPCLSCGDSNQEDGCVIVFDCQEKHVICLDCFKLYINTRLNERQFILDKSLGYTLGCAAGCENALLAQLKHFKLLLPHDYQRYQRFAAEELVLQSGGVLCPQPNCGMGMLTEDRKVSCINCKFVFCRQCLQGFHIGDCDQDLEREDPSLTGVQFALDPARLPLARWNENQDPRTMVAIRLTTKPCPKCRTATERDGGCMHMSCTKPGCGFQWCWVCQTAWSRDCMSAHWFG